jgi:hypothetical protein
VECEAYSSGVSEKLKKEHLCALCVSAVIQITNRIQKMERKKVTKENSYFLKELETLPIDALKNLQFENTKETLKRAYYKSDFYRRRFDKAGVKPEDFKTLEDIARFPFMISRI